MNRFITHAAVALAIGAFSSSAFADEFKIGDITIEQAWSRATPPSAPTGAGYLVVTNGGSEADTLVAASASFARKTEIHEMAMDGDVMKMRQVDGGITIAPGESVELKPGGLHVMFMGLKDQFKEGEMREATLTFRQAGTVTVEFAVKPIGHGTGGHSGHGSKHGS